MQTITQTLNQLTDPAAVTQSVKDMLARTDPGFPEEEARFQAAARELREKLEGKTNPTAEQYLRAKDAAFAAAVTYIGWQGFCLNRDIFQNPVNALLLEGSFEDLCRERRLGTLPGVIEAERTANAFCEALRTVPEEDKTAMAAVTDFYADLETSGYKLAHYWGFRLADGFLGHVIPGYTPDSVLTARYRMELSRYLRVELLE